MKRNHSFGKLRRKNKQNISDNNDIYINEINNNNYNNIDLNIINDYNTKKINYNNYNTVKSNNPLHSRYNRVYSSFKNKSNNQSDFHYSINSNTKNNYNTNNIINTKISPISRPFKSVFIHKNENNEINDNLNDDYYLCQNCINEHLIEEKRKQKEIAVRNNNNISGVFEDKNKLYTEKRIKEKIKERQKNIIEAYHSLEKYNENNKKDKLINENENAPNPLLQYSPNYLYENFRAKYAQKQKFIKENYNKFKNSERPEITKYFTNYINNPNYKAKEYGEYKPKIFDIENYRKDLSEQINYKINKKRKEKEEDKKNEDKEHFLAMKKIQEEKEEKAWKKKKIKEELINGNLEIINEKKEKKGKILREEMKYKEIYEKEKNEFNNNLLQEKYKKNKINEEFVMENKKNLNRIKRDKEQKKLEENNYKYIDYSYEPPKEITDKCYKCHKEYPKKLLTHKKNIFGFN